MDKNTQSGLDARAAKALDGLSLTPRPKPAVQQEVSQDPFTDRALSRAQRRRARDAESPTRLTQVARHAGRFLIVITTYQMNARDPTPLWTPPAPYTIRPPVPPPRLMFTRAPYHIQPLGGPQLPWPVPLMLTPVAPPLTESPALPALPENY